jgi:hypothetical protein
MGTGICELGKRAIKQGIPSVREVLERIREHSRDKEMFQRNRQPGQGKGQACQGHLLLEEVALLEVQSLKEYLTSFFSILKGPPQG